MQVTRFLKMVLGADAASCLAMGALLAAGHKLLAVPFGLPESLLLGAGLALLPIGLFMLWVARRSEVPGLFVWAIVLGNAAWVAESLVVIRSVPTISQLGTLFVLVQAGAVAALALLEALAARRASAPAIARA